MICKDDPVQLATRLNEGFRFLSTRTKDQEEEQGKQAKKNRERWSLVIDW